MDCGCTIQSTFPVPGGEIKYCPLHDAAGDFLKAARLAAECFAEEPCPLAHDDDDPCWLELTIAVIAKATP